MSEPEASTTAACRGAGGHQHGVGDRGLVRTRAPQVLDMITEVQPNLRQLPFDEFVNVMCRELPGSDSVDAEVRETFSSFAGPDEVITSSSLQQALSSLGEPVSKLMSDEMVREAVRCARLQPTLFDRNPPRQAPPCAQAPRDRRRGRTVASQKPNPRLVRVIRRTWTATASSTCPTFAR
eukprot:5690534-Prymnesium_polylepis.1